MRRRELPGAALERLYSDGGRRRSAAELVQGRSFEELFDGTLDGAFMCGLPYVRLRERGLEALAAPVPSGRSLRRPAGVLLGRDRRPTTATPATSGRGSLSTRRGRTRASMAVRWRGLPATSARSRGRVPRGFARGRRAGEADVGGDRQPRARRPRRYDPGSSRGVPVGSARGPRTRRWRAHPVDARRARRGQPLEAGAGARSCAPSAGRRSTDADYDPIRRAARTRSRTMTEWRVSVPSSSTT